MDLFGPSRTMSLGGNYYALVIVDDYSRFTCTLFLTHKRDAFHDFKKLTKIIQNKKNLKTELFCDENEIEHNFSARRTPQENRLVVKRLVFISHLLDT